MPRPAEREGARTDRRAPEELRPAEPRKAPVPRSPESVVLRLQAEIGNAAVARLLARAPETDVKPRGPATAPPAPAGKPADAGTEAEPPITNTGVTGAQDWFDRAYAHYQAGRFEKAAAAFAEAYRLYPVPTFLYNEAAALERLGRNAEAADLYARYLAESPGATDAAKVTERIARLRGAGAGQQSAGKTGGATPTPPPSGKPEAAEPPITAPGMTGAALWNERGVAHYKAKRFEKARAAFAEAYKLNPMSIFLYNQADALEQLGRSREAADLYERYLAEGPISSDIPKLKSRIRKLRGEQIPVGEDDDEPPITAKGKEGAQAWFDRGQEAFLARRFAKAADCFRRAFALMPHAAFIFNEGSALEMGRHPAAAANAYEHYLILDPSAKESAELIAKIKTLRGQAPPAGPDALLDPEDEESAAPAVTATGNAGAGEWHNRGQVAWQLGDFKRAYDCFVQAYDLKPYPNFVYNQAASLDKLGNADAAVQAYERYLAVDPKAKDAEKVRRRIKLLRAGPAGAEVKKP